MKNKATIIDWMINPFIYVAGTKALLIGLTTMVLISVIAWVGNTHFDGIIDIHMGCWEESSSYTLHLFYQLSSWLILVMIFYITSRIVSKTDIRLIDIAGTMALAQAPLLFAALFGLIPSFHLCFGDLSMINLESLMIVLKDNFITIFILALVFIVFTIWSLILKYNAYVVSANVKGLKAMISFIIALFICEVISMIIIYALSPLFI